MKRLSFHLPTNKLYYKMWLSFLIFVFVQLFTTVELSAQNYNVDNTEPYELVIPKLDVLHTNIIFSKEDQLQTTVYYKNSTGYVLIGDVITSDTLIKYIQTSDLLKKLELSALGDKGYRGDVSPLVKNLSVYCDSFVLDKSLWFPEIDVLIHSRKVNFTNKSMLKTTPRPWKVNTSAIKADDGLKAGEIKIITETGSNIMLESTGSDGGSVLFPTVSFTAPTVIESVEIHRCEPRIETTYGKCSSNISYRYTNGDGQLGLLFLNQDKECSDAGRTRQFICKDSNFSLDVYHPKVSEHNPWDFIKTVLKDSDADKRLQFDNRDPGKSGEGGQNFVYSEKPLNYYSNRTPGVNGHYFKSALPNSDVISLSYDTEGDYVIGKINLTQKKKYLLSVGDSYVRDTHFGRCDDFDFEGKNHWVVYFNQVDTRDGKNRFRDFEDKYKYYKYYKYRDLVYLEPARNSIVNKYAPSVIYLKHKLILVQNKIRDFQSLNQTDKTDIMQRIKFLGDGIEIAKNVLKDDLQKAQTDDKGFYELKIAEVDKLERNLLLASKNLNNQYLDEFNNPLGYRPVLSFTANVALEKDVKTDLMLYLRANEAMKNVNERAELIKNIPALLINLDTAVCQGYRDLKQNELRMKKLGDIGEILAKEAFDLNKDLVETEKRLMEKAKKDAEDEKVLRMGAKVLAVGGACLATGLGGPAAGGITYTMIDKLTAAGLDANYSKADNVEVPLRNIDLPGFMNGWRTNELKVVQKELADVDYRKDNGFFKDFGKWKVDSNKTLLTTKLPESLELYKSKKEELSGRLKELNEDAKRDNAMAAFVVKGGEEIFNTFVKTEYLNNAIDRVVNKSPELKLIGEKVKRNAYENGKYGSEFRSELQIKGEITDKIWDLSNKKHKLNAIKSDIEAYSDPLLANSIALIQNQALERLKRMEYQLIKVYNYTKLEAYPLGVSNYRALASNEFKATQDLSTKLSLMEDKYTTTMKTIKAQITTGATTGHLQDLNGAKITVTDEALDVINEGKYYTIDLYNDFNDEIISPDMNNIRIIEFSLEDFKLSRPLKGTDRIELKITFDDKGVLRKDEKLYLFVDDKNSIETWRWTLTEPTKGNTKQADEDSSVNSEIYNEMLNYLITEGGDKTKSVKNLFTLKPAWSKIKVFAKIMPARGSEPIKIEKLKFKVQRDYENITTPQKVCDFRIDATDISARLVVRNKTQNKIDTLSHSQYNVLTDETKFNFDVEAYSIDQKKIFSHWETEGVDTLLIKGNKIIGLDINIKYGKDVRIKSVFKDKPLLSSNQSIPKEKQINLYETPNLTSDVALKIPLSYLKQNSEIEDIEINGFKKIIYGFEEYFVNSKDLE